MAILAGDEEGSSKIGEEKGQLDISKHRLLSGLMLRSVEGIHLK